MINGGKLFLVLGLSASLCLITACDSTSNTDNTQDNSPQGNAPQDNPETSSATVGKPFTRQITSKFNETTFELIEAPEGMTINPRTGKIYWTPTPNQAGNISIKIKKSSNNSETLEETIELEVNDSPGSIDFSQAVFISPQGSESSNNATYDEPNLNTKLICDNQDNYPNLTTIYYRGGTYHNPNFGNSLNNKSIPKITCKGTKDKPITLKPWGNEKVKIKFDGNYGLQIHGDYIRLENFEIEGMAQEISYNDAVEHWWTNEKYYNASALQYLGTGIEIVNNIIHDAPGAGLNNKGKKILDDLLIEGNIIFNNSWWNTGGTTAIGVVGADENSNVPRSSEGANIVIKNNLVFSNESRIFSHVFSKGFSHLTIDEGSSTLLKRNKGRDGTYNKGFLLKDNFYLFNGKGVSLRWDDIRFVNNTFYNNGTTIAGGAGAFRSNGGTNLSLLKNAVFAGIDGTNAIDFSDSVTLKACKDNFFWQTLSKEQACAVGSNNNILKETMFKDPENNDFTTENNIGASTKVFEKHRQKMEEYGYKIKPANYHLKINGEYYPVNSPQFYQKQIDDILGNLPTGAEYEVGDFDGKGDNNDYKITFPDTNNPTESTEFILKVD